MTTHSNDALVVGSASWEGLAACEEGDEFHQRAAQFLDDIKWDKLTTICSAHHGGVPCVLKEGFSMGHFNMVRRVVFEDGISWIVRLRMPDLEDAPPFHDTQRALSSEIAWMKYLKEHSSIPVPEVYHYDLGPNEVGAPYIAMQYIPGSTADTLCSSIDGPPFQYGTPEQDQKFRQQMASIQVELASLTFDKIGSLYQDLDTGEFYIGEDLRTGKGPFNSSMEYFRSLANYKLEKFIRSAPPEELDDSSLALPVLFERLMERYSNPKSRQGPFGIAHQDFGAHNLLVNEKFEILAVIDFDGLIAAPAEMQALFPIFSGFNMEIPFQKETRPAVRRRIETERPLMKAYQSMVLECEKKMSHFADESFSPGSLMLSHVAALVYGLECYGVEKRMNQEWMLAFSRLLRHDILPLEGLHQM